MIRRSLTLRRRSRRRFALYSPKFPAKPLRFFYFIDVASFRAAVVRNKPTRPPDRALLNSRRKAASDAAARRPL